MNDKGKLAKRFFHLPPGLWAMILAVGLALVGCNWFRSTSDPESGLEVTLSSADKTVYRPGEAITLRLHLQNHDQTPILLTFGSSQEYDFWVLDQNGAEVWRWSAGKVFLYVMGYWTIQAGDEAWFQETWEQKDRFGATVPPGNYSVHARVTASPIADKIYTTALTIR